MHFPANTFWGKPHVPTVVTIHDLALLEFPDRFFRTRWAAAKYRARFSRLGGIASRVIAGSGHTAGRIVERSPHPCEMVTIHHGIDDRFRDASNVRSPVDGRILYAGALDFRKNLTRLLEAFDIVRRTRSRAHLVLAGRRGTDKRVYPLIELEVRRLALGPSVEIVANPDDARLVDLYRSAAAFVFPSLYEGFGLPVLEAMAAGCPVACSRAASLPEVAGDAALLFDAEDPEAMAEAIESILDDAPLAASLSAAGRERAEGFTWERCARATLGVYRAVLGNGK
jgi:glycosyltransferase involved in cell wall biosynthesis